MVSGHLPRMYQFLRSFDTVLSLDYDLLVYWTMTYGLNILDGHLFKDRFLGDGMSNDEWRRFRKTYREQINTLVFYPHGSLAKFATDSAKNRVPQTSTGARKPIGSVQTLVGAQAKQSARMPVEAHARVGELIKTVMAVSDSRKGVPSKLDLIRCVLDGWAQTEHPDLPSDQFFNLYYPNQTMTFPKTILVDERIRLVGNLNEVKQILTTNYPDGRPLRSVISKVDLAIKSMMTWNG